MTIQLSTGVRNAMLDAIESTIGTAAIVRLRTGAQPADTSTADSGTVVAEFTLASDWAAAASSGSKSFNNTPLEDASANATGIIAHYRVYASDGTTCHMQGSVTETGGGGDMTIDNNDVNSGQVVRITSWTISMSGHA